MSTVPEAQARRILVTGAAGGIGAGLTERLLARGYSVVAADRDVEALQDWSASLERAGAAGRLSCRQLDVCDMQSIAAATDVLDEVDILVNNAGVQHVSRLEDFEDAAWSRLIEVMLVGSARLMRAVLPGMRSRGFGRIVNMGSIHSLVASPFKSAYVAAKHGLVGLTRTLALETADTEITVNTICPSYVRTALVQKQIEQQARVHGISVEEVVQRIMLAPMPKRRFIEIDEIEGAVRFLLSHEARNVTGQCLVIDGGWTCQ